MAVKRVWLVPDDYQRIADSAEGGFRIVRNTWQLKLCPKHQDLLIFPDINMEGDGIRARIKGRGNKWTALEVFR